MDCTLTWMHANLPPRKWNLRTYVQINWMGDYTVAEVLEQAELASELPPELFRRFLKYGNAQGVTAGGMNHEVEVKHEESHEVEVKHEVDSESLRCTCGAPICEKCKLGCIASCPCVDVWRWV